MTYQSFRLLDMFMSEEELPIQITEVDCIEIDNMHFAKAGEDKILEELASDTPGSNKKHTRLW